MGGESRDEAHPPGLGSYRQALTIMATVMTPRGQEEGTPTSSGRRVTNALAESDLEILHGARVLIVEDHQLFGEAISWALEQRGIEVVGLTGDADEALATVRRERPSLVLMDLGLPAANGLLVGKVIVEEMPETRVLVTVIPRAM